MSPRTCPSPDHGPYEIDPAGTLGERIRLEGARLSYGPSWVVGQGPGGSWRGELAIGLVTERFAGHDELSVLQALLDALRRAGGVR